MAPESGKSNDQAESDWAEQISSSRIWYMLQITYQELKLEWESADQLLAYWASEYVYWLSGIFAPPHTIASKLHYMCRDIVQHELQVK